MIALHINFVILVLSTLFYSHTSSSSVQLSAGNLPQILEKNEFVLVNFYADWCRFSQILSPIYDEAAQKVKEEFPQEGKIVLGKIDCDKETSVSSQYHVSKYPTIKMFRNGQLIKREYRGQRSVEAIVAFVQEQVKDPIQRHDNMDTLDTLDRKKRNVIGYFDNEDNDEYRTFMRVASVLRDDCVFHIAMGEVSEKERIVGNKVFYRPPNDQGDMLYSGVLYGFDILKAWATDKCVPFVREITFENAEELTEEGLPFLILFHDPSDTDTPERFRKHVIRELLSEKNSINILTADGIKFSHPLYHLGKTTNDLPMLAIDSFRHMYLWPQSPKESIDKPGLLKQFVSDLHSGKLHREFHHGPDPTTKGDDEAGDSTHIPKEGDEQPPQPTTPPESTFKKLAPSQDRYTILRSRDEL